VIRQFEHAGIAVSDLDRTLHFYVDLLGMRLIKRKQNVRGPGEVAFVDCGRGEMLELMQPGEPMTGPVRKLPNNEVGVRHLTFLFDNIDETYAKLMAAGVTSVEKPRDAFNTEILARVAFVLDPDGLIIELAQR
jgi:glyoxylase I family protein